MNTIYKYPISNTDKQTIQMPRGALILTAGMQENDIYLWAQVYDNNPMADRQIEIIGTGFPIEENEAIGYLSYINTVFDGAFVWHIFERLQSE
jgi:hypothetical protein